MNNINIAWILKLITLALLSFAALLSYLNSKALMNLNRNNPPGQIRKLNGHEKIKIQINGFLGEKKSNFLDFIKGLRKASDASDSKSSALSSHIIDNKADRAIIKSRMSRKMTYSENGRKAKLLKLKRLINGRKLV